MGASRGLLEPHARRAGPGSPRWKQAERLLQGIAVLCSIGGGLGADEKLQQMIPLPDRTMLREKIEEEMVWNYILKRGLL